MAPSTLLGAQESWPPQSIGESNSDASVSTTRSNSISSGSSITSSSSSSSGGSRTKCMTNTINSNSPIVEHNQLPRQSQRLVKQAAPIGGVSCPANSSSSRQNGQQWPAERGRQGDTESGESSAVSGLSGRQEQDLLPESCDEPLKRLVGRDELEEAALIGSPGNSSSSFAPPDTEEEALECLGAKLRGHNKRQHDDGDETSTDNNDANIDPDCCLVGSNLSKSSAAAASASRETSVGPETLAGHANGCSRSNNSTSTASVNNNIYSSSGRNVTDKHTASNKLGASERDLSDQTIELRFLVRRREAGALIGKRGSNIKRLRESFRSSMFSIPDTGNGPERVVCIATDQKSMDAILTDLTQLLMEKSPENDDQIELKLLIHSSHAGSIIGIGGQSIKKLRNDSRAAIKIYEMCCPLSNERVCAIKAKPPVVVSTIKLVLEIISENPIKGPVKPYDALYFDLGLIDKYGGYLPDEASLEALSALAMGQQQLDPPSSAAAHHQHLASHHHYHHQHGQAALANYTRQLHEDMYSAAMAAANAAAAAASSGPKQHYSSAHWRSPGEYRETCELPEMTSWRAHGAMGVPEPGANLASRALKKSFNNSNSSAAALDCQSPAAAILKRAGELASACDDHHHLHQHLPYPPQQSSAPRGRFHPYAHQQRYSHHQHQLQQADSFPAGGYSAQQQQPRFQLSHGPIRGGNNSSTHCGGVRLAAVVHGLQNEPPEDRCSQRPGPCMCTMMQLPVMVQSSSPHHYNNNNHHQHHHPHHQSNSNNNHHHSQNQQRNTMTQPTATTSTITCADLTPITTTNVDPTSATTTTGSRANSIVSSATNNVTTFLGSSNATTATTTTATTTTQHEYNNNRTNNNSIKKK